MEIEPILALLQISSPQGGEQQVPVSHSPFNIGRIQPNDLVLPNAKVSRAHARLLIEDDRLLLIDLNSSNGTFVGSARLTPNEPYPLSFGVNFVIGPFTLRLEPAPPPVSQPGEAEKPREPVLDETVAPDEPVGELVSGTSAGEPVPAAPSPDDAQEPLVPDESSASQASHVTVGVVELPPPIIPGPPSSDGGGRGGAGNYDEAIGLSDDHSRYLQYLPPIYSEDRFLGKFLLAFEGILLPIEQMVDNFDQYLDPLTAPEYFLDQIAAWLDLTLDEKWPLEKRRRLVNEAAELYRKRGTRAGLSRHLEIYSGVAPEIRESESKPHHFEVLIKATKDTRLDRATLDRIILANMPAHATYGLEVDYV
jgi:phage tail-like protein